MLNTKNKLINKIDISYRDIENFENQYQVMSSILNLFTEKQLKKILTFTNKIKKKQK